MAEVQKLNPPAALYDYILYYEPSQKGWKDASKRLKLTGDGSSVDAVNWSMAAETTKGDSGGATKFGVTHKTWKKYGTKGKSLNEMTKEEWIKIVNEYFWEDFSYASSCANYACAFVMFQMVWGGFSGLNNVFSDLKSQADKTDYKFSGSGYKKIANATHAFSDPMKAYLILRKHLNSYYYNLSAPGKKNAQFRMGWLTRSVFSFTFNGLYIPSTISYKTLGLSTGSTLEQWDSATTSHIQSGAKGMNKILDWSTSPDSVTQLGYSSTSSYDSSSYSYNGSGFNPYSSSLYQSLISSDAKYGGVYKLGNYASQPDAEIEYKQSQNKDDVLNTLVNGSYEKEEIKKCVELISPDKKKNAKNKSKT